MIRLTEKPPVSVEIGGARVPVNADFRVILCIDALHDQGMTDAERGLESLRLFYGALPVDIETATERMLWFLRCGEKEKQAVAWGGKPPKPDFSFVHDAPMILAAFRDQYDIDLVSIDFLHWWEFRALFDGLRSGHLFCEVRRIRSMDLSKVKDNDQRKYYREMQKASALPLPEGQQEELDASAEALMNGGNVSALIRG